MNRRRLVNNTKHRSVIGITNFTMTALVLLLVFVTVNASFNSRIADISDNLGRALNKALDFENDTFTEAPINPTYKMNVTFDPKGMAGLYNITTLFMGWIQADSIVPDGLEVDDNGNLNLSKLIDNFPSLLKQYAGLLALTIIGLLFIILMPLVGIIFCCCRCCGNCGARSQPFDKKHDMCKKIFLATILICVATLLLFGVVCAFVSNQHMQEGTEQLPKDLRKGINDMQMYITTTDSQINTLLVINFGELKTSLMSILRNSSKIISAELTNLTHATSFTNLALFVNSLDEISDDLDYMKNSTNVLRVDASQLSDGLRRVKNDLLHSLNDCKVSECSPIKDKVNRMNTTMDFDKLPDVTETITKLSDIIKNGQLSEQIKKGNESFSKIESNIRQSVDDNIPKVENSIDSAGNSLNGGYQNVSEALIKLNKTFGENGHDPVDQADKYIQEYSKYRNYVGIAESSVLLIIIVCITLGLMCGICGKRPDGYDDDCCNKGAGSRFLMMGVGIMFLFSFLIMLITLVYFLVGMITQRAVCDTLRDPHNSKIFDLLNDLTKINNTFPSNISQIIHDCHNNKSIYNVLKLENQLNISNIPSYLDKFNITDQMNDFKNNIQLNENISIFNEETERGLEELKNSGIGDIKFDRFMEVLEHNITSIDLNEMAESLKQLATKMSDNGMKMSLKQNAMYLEMYQKNLVNPMVTTAEQLKVKAVRLKELLQMNHEGANFTTAIENVKQEVKDAEEHINGQGKNTMREIAENFIVKFEEKLLNYIYYVGNKTIDHVGNCAPISNVYNATLVATCDNILNPWNGFWVCVGWCLILFIPGIIVSVKLATLYQKSESYPGPGVEAEYLYDAYADRENIPLSNVPHKKGKKKKRGGNSDMYDTRGAYAAGDGPRNPDLRSAPPRERDAPGGSSHPDTRYADMAPKHWDDYPNGGPPQYQSAPMATEYERPPPYYYPGPGERP